MSWIESHDVGPVSRVESIDLEAQPLGSLRRVALAISTNSLSQPLRVPVLLARGGSPGPTVGITAVVHGNELNGIPTLHHLFQTITPESLRGNIIAVTIANVPAYTTQQRCYPDGQDLNRLMPGVPEGDEAQLYAHRLMDRVIRHVDYLIDLHTASFGRVNTLYVRADMSSQGSAQMARCIGAKIILHSTGDKTLRGVTQSMGKPAITLEIGNPQVWTPSLVRTSRIGIRDVLETLGLLDPDQEHSAKHGTVECSSSYWLYTDMGGLLSVRVSLGQRVDEGDEIAHLHDPWGQLVRTYHAPENGIVIGKSTNPCAPAGARIVHLGVVI